MIYTMNLAWLDEEFERYGSVEGLREYLKEFGLSGIEYLSYKEVTPRYPNDIIYGVHLRFPESWVDMWKGNISGILDEYVDIETAKRYFGPDMRKGMVENLREQLLFAKRAEAKYVVFHISEIKLKETVTRDYLYSGEEVIRASAELINEAIAGLDIDYYFLMENLWWNGFTMTDPKLTKLLIDLVDYEKKGIMLDTGHLLHTEPSLKDEVEGLAYINHILDIHGDLCRYIKGVHLHQSITGKELNELKETKINWANTYDERNLQVMEHIFKIDQHKPYACKGVKELLERVDPEYVTLEFISTSHEEHKGMLKEQMKWL